MRKIKIWIPRWLFYYKYINKWKIFFEELWCEIVESPKTNKSIIRNWIDLSIDEVCFSVKIFMWHVFYLKDKVDYILIPNITCLKNWEEMCIKYYWIYDIISNTIEVPMISYIINDRSYFQWELFGFIKMWLKFTKNIYKIIYAYYLSQKQPLYKQIDNLLSKNKINILLLWHSYILQDEVCWILIKKLLEHEWVNVVTSDDIDPKELRRYNWEISKNIHWTYNIEIIWALEYFIDKVDWLIFLTSFPCWPDSIVNDLVQRRIKWKIHILNIVIDEHSWELWLKTRIESFIDMINFKLHWKK